MAGTSLSRWTMAYFACALLSLLLAEGLFVSGFGFPLLPIAAPQTLILVHLIVIGWMSLLMSGALLQFLPVLVARPLFYATLPIYALGLLCLGLIALLAGFFSLTGANWAHTACLPIGGLLLSAGFSLNIWNLARTLLSGGPTTLPTRFVAVGLAALVVAMVLGLIFTFSLSGLSSDSLSASLLTQGVSLHASLGLGGWLSFTAIGVSYRLLAMFMLAPESERRSSTYAFRAGTIALVLIAIAGPALVLVDLAPVSIVLIAALALSLLCLSLYGFDVVRLFRQRKRRKLELNSRMSAWALCLLAVSALLMLVGSLVGWSENRLGAVIFLFVFGWLSGLGLGMLYKITAFLSWLESYGRWLGKRPTPRVQELVREDRALTSFRIYFIIVILAAIAIFMGQPLLFRGCAVVMAVVTLQIIVELIRIRRLHYITDDLLPPATIADAQAPRPHLLFAHN